MFSDTPRTPLKRKAMSLTQTYYLAHTARGKLSAEAARADHDLRLLVGHANLLDSLMLDLASAEQEQESWFNQSVQSATKNTTIIEESERHIQWADAIVEDEEEDWDADDADSSDSDDSDYDDDEEMIDAEFTTLYRTSSRPIQIPSTTVREIEDEDEDFEDDGEEDYAALSLTPSPSHPAGASPPELSHDSEDSESEDDSMPPSPPSTILPTFSEKQAIATTSFYGTSNRQSLSPAEQSSFLNEGFFIPQRTEPQAISVY